MEAGLGVGKQTGGQLVGDGDRDEEIDEQKSEERAANFEHAAGAAPAHALRVVEDGAAFLHAVTLYLAARRDRMTWLGGSPSARIYRLYCKMRCKNEANFLASHCGADDRLM